jgi:hypothetical protein
MKIRTEARHACFAWMILKFNRAQKELHNEEYHAA